MGNLHRQAMTMTMLGAISCQLLNVWTMRSWDFPAWSVGIASNPLLLAAMAVEVIWIWMLLNIGPVQKVFNTASVALSDLWILLPFPVLLFVTHEFYKWWRRRSSPLAEEIAQPDSAPVSPLRSQPTYHGDKNP